MQCVSFLVCPLWSENEMNRTRLSRPLRPITSLATSNQTTRLTMTARYDLRLYRNLLSTRSRQLDAVEVNHGTSSFQHHKNLLKYDLLIGSEPIESARLYHFRSFEFVSTVLRSFFCLIASSRYSRAWTITSITSCHLNLLFHLLRG